MSVTRVEFKPNIRVSGNHQFKPSSLVGCHGKVRVFSTPELEEFVFHNGITDTELRAGIWVALKRYRSSYEAYPLPLTMPKRNAELVVARKRVALFIDGQNLLLSLRAAKIKLPPAEVIELICRRYEVEEMYFYICPSKDVGNRKLISEQHLEEIRTLPGMRVVLKKNHENGSDKGNIDHLLLHGMYQAYYEKPGLEGVVVVSGDGGFHSAIKTWSLGKGHGGPKFVEVISSKDALSSSLAGDQSISTVYLEDICSSAAAV
ncbi:MAG: NYN domain-containing protein [Patescibacteria group bacterium]|nr:NYN domain-containing protein [Patescibacteria group bacterium]